MCSYLHRLYCNFAAITTTKKCAHAATTTRLCLFIIPSAHRVGRETQRVVKEQEEEDLNKIDLGMHGKLLDD